MTPNELIARAEGPIRQAASDLIDSYLVLTKGIADLIAALKEQTARAERAEADLAKAVETLRPFSEMAGEMFARNWNDDGVAISFVTPEGCLRLTFEEFRAARVAFAAITGGRNE